MTERDIFIAALEIVDPDGRAAYLAEACAGDHDRRRRLERLLHAHEGAENFLAQPAVAHEETQTRLPTGAAPPSAEGPGTILGRYKLLQEIGEGGMGVVFMAEQREPVHRMVAVKIIKPGMDSRQVIARFEAERQALALMDHANIARVFDAGTTAGGLPYFVMELVKGVPIITYCDDNHLTPRERLELFIPVCQAVQHAHQKGIIHRDLKPSNVLISPYDGKPVPKVIDFGVAKAISQRLTERTLFTQFGQVVGTLEYMSPEQAELNALDVDTRSDVYALGVLLYELLTGSTPFERKRLREAAFDEVLRIIREEEPPKPSTRLSSSETLASIAAQRNIEPAKLGKLLRGDLDWIVMKALDKDRTRRYETATGIVLDIQHYLADEPVSAGPPTASYRLRKFVRRNRGAVLGVCVLLVTLIVGMAGTTWGLLNAHAAQQKTAAALEAETQARRRTRTALATLTDDVIETVFGKQPNLGENEKAFLRKVLGFYEDFAQELGDTDEARSLRADGYYQVGLIRSQLGETSEAEGTHREALRLREELAGRDPQNSDRLQKLAASQHSLGNVLSRLGKSAEAEKYLQAAVGQRDALVARYPDTPAYLLELVNARMSLAILYMKLTRNHEAETVLREVLVQHAQLIAFDAARPAYRHRLAQIHTRLAQVLKATSQFPEATAAYENAVAILTKLVAEFPAVPDYLFDLGGAQNNLGNFFNVTFRSKDAEAPCRAAIAAFEKLAADYPSVPTYRRDLAKAYAGLAFALILTDRTKEVEEAYRSSLTLRERLTNSFPEVVEYRDEFASAYIDLGNFLRSHQRPLEAETAYKQALTLYEKAYAADNTNPQRSMSLASCYVSLCHVNRDMHRPEQVIEWAVKTIASVKPVLDRDPRLQSARLSMRNAHWGRAAAFDELKRHGDAIADWDRTVEFSPPEDHQYFRMQKYLSQAHLGDPSLGEHLEEEVRIAKKRTGGFYYDIACLYAMSSASRKNDPKRRELHAVRAVANLRESLAKGQFKDPKRLARLKEDKALDALREREDFRKFMSELAK